MQVALVAPFRGLHYNPAKVSNLTEVVTPPYDVIRPAEREAFAARHPNNMVHLILPQPLPGDDRLQNRYTRAAALFRQWQQEEVLVRDPASRLSIIGRPTSSMPGRELHPPGSGGPGAPGALERRGHPAPRADLFRGQGRPPGAVQTGPGAFLPHLFASIPIRNIGSCRPCQGRPAQGAAGGL